MLEKYVRYDVEGLVRDYKDNCMALKNLKKQMKTLDGFCNSLAEEEKVQSSRISDKLEKLIIRREELAAKIEGYEAILSAYNRAWKQLDKQEQEILTELLQKKQGKQKACQVIGEKYFIQPTRIYELRKEALGRIGRMVFGI